MIVGFWEIDKSIGKCIIQQININAMELVHFIVQRKYIDVLEVVLNNGHMVNINTLGGYIE